MEQQRKTSPGFYKGVAAVFFFLGALFVWAAIRQHSWFFGAFGAITLFNGFMSILKSAAATEINK